MGLILGERIQGILKKNSEKIAACEGPERAELQEKLNGEQLALVEDYLNTLISQQAEKEKYIYLEGVKDGIALLSWVRTV